jgi:hypothetical protein
MNIYGKLKTIQQILICIVVKSVTISSNAPAEAITRVNINQDLIDQPRNSFS